VDDVTRELEDAVADSSSRKGKGKKATSSVNAGPSSSAPKRKRGSKTTKSEDESDILDLVDGTSGSSKRRAAKRKKFATDEGLNAAEELERFADDVTQPDDSVDGQSQSGSKRPSGADYDGDFKVKAKKRPPRKKKPGAGDTPLTTTETTEQAGQNASPESPMLAGFYNIGEPIPDLKKGKKVDQLVLARRLVALEEAQRKVWLNIARRDIPKVRNSCHLYRRTAGVTI
jgi:chromatin-remodeling ATPase INO80